MAGSSIGLQGVPVELRGVSRGYGRGAAAVVALREVDLSVAAGEFVALLGPSGSGKSTLLNVVGGLDAVTAGEVVVAGRDLGALSERERTRFRRREVGFVFQHFHLVPVLTALENVLLAAQLVGRGAAAEGWLAQVGLAGRAGRFPGELSGGEQQRVAVARALVKAPRLVLADEPTGNLDSVSGRLVVEALRRARDAHGCTVLLVTHDEALTRFADRVVRLRDGSVVGERGLGARVEGNPDGEGAC